MANCFWWGELEQELRDRGLEDYRFYNDTTDREKRMDFIEKKRCQSLYPHPEKDCLDEYKARSKQIKFFNKPFNSHFPYFISS